MKIIRINTHNIWVQGWRAAKNNKFGFCPCGCLFEGFFTKRMPFNWSLK